MNCNKYEDLISRLIDNELSDSERGELNDHIMHCEACRALYAAFSDISAIIESDLADVPADLTSNIMAEIRRDNIKAVPAVRKNKKAGTYIALAASIAAIALFGIFAPGMRTPKLGNATLMSESAVSAPKNDADTPEAVNGSAVSTVGYARSSEEPEQQENSIDVQSDEAIETVESVGLLQNAALMGEAPAPEEASEAESNEAAASEALFSDSEMPESIPDDTLDDSADPVFTGFGFSAIDSDSPTMPDFDYYISSTELYSEFNRIFPSSSAPVSMPDPSGADRIISIAFADDAMSPIFIYIIGSDMYYELSSAPYQYRLSAYPASELSNVLG